MYNYRKIMTVIIVLHRFFVHGNTVVSEPEQT